MLDLFRDAMATAVSLIGEPALLRGTEPCDVHISHGVQIEGLDDNAVYLRSVATFLSVMTGKQGDLLTHPDGEWELDTLYRDSGAHTKWILRKPYTGA